MGRVAVHNGNTEPGGQDDQGDQDGQGRSILESLRKRICDGRERIMEVDLKYFFNSPLKQC